MVSGGMDAPEDMHHLNTICCNMVDVDYMHFCQKERA